MGYVQSLLFSTLLASLAMVDAAAAQTGAQQELVIETAAALTPEAINAASLEHLLHPVRRPTVVQSDAEITTGSLPGAKPEPWRDPAMVRLQVLLDRAGASPGVIDGFDGLNVRKAIAAFETMQGLPADGQLDARMLATLDQGGPAVGTYTILEQDVAAVVAPLPRDYAELALRDRLGFQSVPELLGERFHMDEKFLRALNPRATWQAGEAVFVTAYGPDLRGKVARIEADKRMRQLRAYGQDGRLIAAYPATIGSPDNPSPSGIHLVEAVAINPTYTYNPKINFQQGENTKVLVLPPGPNGPVGSVWIDLSEPTFGIHGTPQPSLIDKVGSHGCVRLTNWDARELARMVTAGVPVEFID